MCKLITSPEKKLLFKFIIAGYLTLHFCKSLIHTKLNSLEVFLWEKCNSYVNFNEYHFDYLKFFFF